MSKIKKIKNAKSSIFSNNKPVNKISGAFIRRKDDEPDDGVEFDFNSISTKLLQNSYFYGYILLQMKKIKTTKMDFTMGVGVVGGKLSLMYNPKLLSKYNIINQTAILEHEIRHITNGHVYFLDRLSGKIHIIANLAMDMAINGGISGLPANCVNHHDFGFDGGLSCEEYYQLLMTYFLDKLKKQLQSMKGQNGDGKGSESGLSDDFEQKSQDDQLREIVNKIMEEKGLDQMDDHSKLKGDEVPRSLVERIINEALDSAQKAGKEPGNVEQELSWMKSNQINWKKRLRNIIDKGTLPSEDYRWTKNKTSKRYKSVPGIQKDLINANIAAIIDTSGSMTDRSLSLMFGEINRVKQYTDKIKVIEFDVGISDEHEWDFREKVKIVGRGGTTINKEMVDILNDKYRKYFKVLFTDGFINFDECTFDDLKNVVWIINDKNSYETYVNKYPSHKDNIIYFDE